ncbi:MAG: VWA domain-containing protein [Polyangiaceae bacterium]
MAFKLETFQNRHLAPGQTRVDAIVTVTADSAVSTSVSQGGPLVVGFILDKSASMAGERLASVKNAVSKAIMLLPESTSFFVVAFDSIAHLMCSDMVANERNKRAALAQLNAVQAFGGTAMSAGLATAKTVFKRFPNAIRQAIFLTDGENASETPEQVRGQLKQSEGVFQCDCWGIGTDWRVGEVQEIAQALLGKASLIPAPDGVEAAFQSAIEKATSKSLNDVRLRLWTPQTAKLIAVKQVNPTIEELTSRARVIHPQVRDFLTGAWAAGESRDFHLTIEVNPGHVGDEMLAARPSIVYMAPAANGFEEREEKAPEGRVFATWSQDVSLTSRIDRHVAHYTGQDELADAIQRGLELREQGNEAGATQLLGRAVKIAHDSRNTEMTSRLTKVVDVVDASQGTVRLRRSVDKAAAMDLQLESRTTKRVARKPSDGGAS